MQIERLEKIVINGSVQWVLIKGRSLDNPLLLHIQAGPGLPMIPEARFMEKSLNLEDKYLVAYWDQRGCGKSFSKSIDPGTINLDQLTEDLLSCVKVVADKYHKRKITLAGYSIGATISLLAGSIDHKQIERLILTGIDIDIPSADKFAMEYAISKAKDTNNNKLLNKLSGLVDKKIINAKLFQQRAKIITDLGGITSIRNYNKLLINTIINIITCKYYNLADFFKTIKGMPFCQNALLPEYAIFNLFDHIKSVDVPVHFIHGKNDGVSPLTDLMKLYDILKAPDKSINIFENSAHTPHYDEPKLFSSIIRKFKN
jgi:pimeloyl-ACP methyl ester carboxylesterase